MERKKKIALSILAILLCVSLLGGFTYAYWQLTKTQDTENLVNSDCFKVSFEEKEPITLNRAHPVSDQEGLSYAPYTFTITNECDSWANYQINLETVTGSVTKALPEKYLKANLQEEEKSVITTVLNYEKNSNLETNVTIENASRAFKLYTGMLKEHASKTYHLRLWMDEKVTAEEDSMEASYKGKVSIIFSYAENPFIESGTLKVPGSNVWLVTTGDFWTYKDQITKVIFENSLHEHTENEVTNEIKSLNPTLDEQQTLVKVFEDVSANQDESKPVTAYLVANGEDAEGQSGYTLYIQSKGGVKANPDSSDLFNDFTNLKSIEGIKYFDTSEVTDMNGMFWDCSNLSSLDLSNWKTNEVTDMNYMFCGCNNLSTLDVSGWNTSNVKNMDSMFSGCEQLNVLNASSWTANQIKKMNNMFNECTNLTKVNFSNFGASLVEDMEAMFLNCSNLQEIDFGNLDTSHVMNMRSVFTSCVVLTKINIENWDTSSVTDMDSMFMKCEQLSSLNLNNWDTSQVTNMNGMFSWCSNLSSLDLSNWKTNEVTNMSEMFDNCEQLSSLNLSNWNTSQVTDMSFMFAKCTNLSTIIYGKNFIHNDSCTVYFMFTESPANKPQGSSWTGVFVD